MSNSTRITSSHKIICWHLTTKCTKNCEFCLSKSGTDKTVKTKDYIKILDTIKGLGFDKISYSGGEPFIIPEFEEMVRYGEKLGLTQIVATNGDLLFQKQNIEFLKRFQYVKLSFYGMENYHDQLIGNGHFQRLMKLLDILLSNSISIGINYMLTKQSYFDLHVFLKYISRFKLYNFLIQSYIPTGNITIDSKYQIDSDSIIDLSFLSQYVVNFENGIKYFDYNIKDGFQIILDDQLNLHFSNIFNQHKLEYGNLFETNESFDKFRTMNLRELIIQTFEKRLHSESIKTY